jgi:MFS family permease
VVGRLSMGALSDRIGRKPTVAIAMTMQALALLGFLSAHGLPVLYAATLAFGYSDGAISTLFTAVVGDFFGRAHAGTIVGFLFAVAGSMAAWGPVGAGAIYDAWGAYDLAFALAAACNLLALGLLALAHPPRRQEGSETRGAVPQTIE